MIFLYLFLMHISLTMIVIDQKIMELRTILAIPQEDLLELRMCLPIYQITILIRPLLHKV